MRDVDLEAYFKRIGYGTAGGADVATLEALHRLHPAAIPFENLSTLLREPIPLDSAALLDKLVVRRRGGYCFEQNRLFAEVLRALGFEVAALAARVLWKRVGDSLGARTHMVLRVRIGGDDYLSDVGFGGLTLTGPLRLVPDIEQPTPHETFRLARRGAEFELEAAVRGSWRPLYRFDLQEQSPIDFEVLNHFVATHPSSPFLTTLMAARRTPHGRYALHDNVLAVYRGDAKDERKLTSAAEIAGELAESFGIELPRGPALDALLESIAAK
jgi:N-hydroxyarylamine O-acetyltransferase